MPLLMLGLLMVSSIISIFPAGKAYALPGEEYVFWYPEDDNTIQNLQSIYDYGTGDSESNTKEKDDLNKTAVYARGGIWSKMPGKPVKLQYNEEASRNLVSNNPGDGLGAHGFIYTYSYKCKTNGDIIPADIPGPFFRINVNVPVHIEAGGDKGNFYDMDSFRSRVWIGNYSVYDQQPPPGTPRSVDTQNDSDKEYEDESDTRSNIPASCLPEFSEGRDDPFQMDNYYKVRSQWQDYIQSDPSPGGGAGPGGGNPDVDECAKRGGVLTWVMCPVINLANDAIDWITNKIIIPQLRTAPLERSGSMYEVWENIRTIANVFFVLIFLVFIFANSLSYNMNAYTIKKILPKLVAAVVLVQFSYLFSALILDIANILGQGLANVLNVVIQGTGQAKQGGTLEDLGDMILTGLVSGAVIVAVGVPTIIILAITALIATMTVMLTLVARKFIITALVVLSPLAFAAMVLPGTEKIFQTWLRSFIRIALMYPLIILILKIAQVTSYAFNDNSEIEMLLKSILPIIAFFMIPKTFSWAGGVMTMAATGMNRLQGRATGAAKGSQLIRDMKEERKSKGAMKYATSDSRFNRMMGRVQAGSYFPTSRSRERLRGQYNKATAERAPGFDESMNGIVEKPKRLEALEQIAMGNDAGGVKSDAATQALAIKRLGQERAYDSLRKVQDHMSQSERGKRMYNSATQPLIGQFNDNAPDLIGPLPDGGRAEAIGRVASVTPENLADMHASTLETFFKRAESQQIQEITPAIQAVMGSERLRTKIKSGSVAAIYNAEGVGQSIKDQIHVDSVHPDDHDDPEKRGAAKAASILPSPRRSSPDGSGSVPEPLED